MADKIRRVRQCLKRAGLFRIPTGAEESLAIYGLDSLLAVMTVIEMQKEFRMTILAEDIKPDSFNSILTLSKLIPD